MAVKDHKQNVTLKWPSSIPRTQFSEQFLQGMLDRMAVGYHNYGHALDNANRHYSCQNSLERRMKKYRQTKNTEYLMDAANFAMMEFMQPRYPNATFRPTDKSESPGADLMDGRVSKGKEDYDPAKGDRLKK